jgi:hypothetical protein
MRALRAGYRRESCTKTRQTGPACCAQGRKGLHARGREEKFSENLPAAAPPAPDAASIEVLSWFIIVVVATRGACFQRVHGGELWRLPEARPFLSAVTPPKGTQHTGAKAHAGRRRQFGSAAMRRGAAQTVRVSSAAQGHGAPSPSPFSPFYTSTPFRCPCTKVPCDTGKFVRALLFPQQLIMLARCGAGEQQ